MPIGRISSGIAAGRIRTTDAPTGFTKYSGVLTPGTDTTLYGGASIGLLLSLTYASNIVSSTPATFKGESPTGRIRNTD